MNLKKLLKTPPLSKLLALSLLFILSWQVAALIWLWLTPAPDVLDFVPMDHVPTNNTETRSFVFFRSEQVGSEQPSNHAALADEKGLQGWSLLGTLLTDEHQLALVQIGSQGRLTWVSLGERLASGFVVTSIQPQTLSIATKQGVKTLHLSDKSNTISPAQSAENPASSLSDLRKRVQQNPSLAMQWFKLDPQWQNGQLKGVAIAPQKGQESLFKQLGLQQGDVILRLNGEPMQGWMSKIGTLPSVLDQPSASVTVLRQGVEKDVSLNW